MNIGLSGVNLEGVRFGAGLDYTFDAASAVRELAPGERVLVVANQTAFDLRYGTGKRVAGVFQLGSNLDDSGEQIQLAAANGSLIKDFSYNDKNPWPESADGDGWSLVLIKPHTNPAHGVSQNWRPSTTVNGNPGTSDVLNYAAWKTANNVTDDLADDDKDGTNNCSEYFFRTNPASAVSRPTVTGGVLTIAVDPGPGLPPVPGDYLTVSFDRDPAADEATAIPEVSTDLTTWSASMNDLVRVSVTVNPDGTQKELWRTTVPVPGDQRRYGRVRINVP